MGRRRCRIRTRGWLSARGLSSLKDARCCQVFHLQTVRCRLSTSTVTSCRGGGEGVHHAPPAAATRGLGPFLLGVGVRTGACRGVRGAARPFRKQKVRRACPGHIHGHRVALADGFTALSLPRVLPGTGLSRGLNSYNPSLINASYCSHHGLVLQTGKLRPETKPCSFTTGGGGGGSIRVRFTTAELSWDKGAHTPWGARGGWGCLTAQRCVLLPSLPCQLRGPRAQGEGAS